MKTKEMCSYRISEYKKEYSQVNRPKKIPSADQSTKGMKMYRNCNLFEASLSIGIGLVLGLGFFLWL